MLDLYNTEAQVCRDAVQINEGGACNPVPISRLLAEAVRYYQMDHNADSLTGDRGARNRPAIRLLSHQLMFILFKDESLYNNPGDWREDIDHCTKIWKGTEVVK